MKLTLLCLALCIAYSASESCNPIFGTSTCTHTGCSNSTTGWYVVCHRNRGSLNSGTCICTHDLNAGHKCADRSDCQGDCPHYTHSWHCVDESCQCGIFNIG